MKALIAKYKRLKDAGYGREQIAEMLSKENLTDMERKLIIETVFKEKK